LRDVFRHAVSVPDEYETYLRVLGLYPLTLIPVTIVNSRVEKQFMRWHRSAEENLETLGTLTVYQPETDEGYDQRQVRRLIGTGENNRLAVPRPNIEAARTLAAMFAPRLLQDVAGDYDRIGAVIWQGDRIGIDADRPTGYYYLSRAYFNGRSVLQINYVFWFAARNGPNSPAIERGNLDGLTVRVTLDHAGLPVMIDIMNNCGCYHFFVPDRKRIARVVPNPFGFDALVPRWMPEEFPRESLVMRVNSGWHQVVHIGTETTVERTMLYRLVPYDRLESIRRADNRFDSLFAPDGIAKQTDRIEPLLLFPMGIPSVGSMRQRGHHAIILVGRAHFDDPFLFDRNFEYTPVEPGP
jgi:hypothetical protein